MLSFSNQLSVFATFVDIIPDETTKSFAPREERATALSMSTEEQQ